MAIISAENTHAHAVTTVVIRTAVLCVVGGVRNSPISFSAVCPISICCPISYSAVASFPPPSPLFRCPRSVIINHHISSSVSVELQNSSCSRLRFRCRRNHRLMCRTERNRTAYSGTYLSRALENHCRTV